MARWHVKILKLPSPSELRETFSFIRAEIERTQIQRQREDIQSLQRDGISTLPAEALR
jgi:uncharacterized small protein (DUF1192 family)